MTSYSAMAARGREEALARTKGRRKVIAERIEYTEPDRSNVTPFPGSVLPPYRTVEARLIGSCGHTLRWLAAVPLRDGKPIRQRYLDDQVGRRMTCPHDDCKIAPKPVREPRETDCTFIIGTDPDPTVGRRCRTTAKWDTEMGLLCTRHRTYLADRGYLPGAVTEIKRPSTKQEQ